jgi:hypothetical protein
MNAAKPVVGRPAVFIHIQKTAGTSVTETVWQYYVDSIISHGDFMNHTPESLKQFRFVSGHFGFEFVRELVATRYSFTFLRDPVERVLSFYYFCRTRDPKEYEIYAAAHQMPLADFLRAGRAPGLVYAHISDQQAWQLAWGWQRPQVRMKRDVPNDELLALAKANLRKLSFVGFAETFDADFRKIMTDLGLPPPAKAPRSNATGPRPGKASLTAEELQLIREVTPLDQAIYDEAWALRGRTSQPVKTGSAG